MRTALVAIVLLWGLADGSSCLLANGTQYRWCIDVTQHGLKATSVSLLNTSITALSQLQHQRSRGVDYAGSGLIIAPSPQRVDTATILNHSGAILINTTGRYTFHLRSCGAAQLWLADELLIDNDGQHMSCEVLPGFVSSA